MGVGHSRSLDGDCGNDSGGSALGRSSGKME